MFVVHLMRPANGAHIKIIASGKPPETLVNDYVVNKKISKTISHYAKAKCLQPVNFIKRTKEDTEKTGDGKNDKKGIIFFKKPGTFLVMVFMQKPEKTMHYVTVCEPCYSFHGNKDGDK